MNAPRPCPICRRPVAEDPGAPTYPFCSVRCRQVDLGNWLTERYRISQAVEESDGVDADTPVEDEKEAGA